MQLDRPTVTVAMLRELNLEDYAIVNRLVDRLHTANLGQLHTQQDEAESQQKLQHAQAMLGVHAKALELVAEGYRTTIDTALSAVKRWFNVCSPEELAYRLQEILP